MSHDVWSSVDTHAVTRWTRAQVTGLAPDDTSVRAATKLAIPGPWSDTGSTDAMVWGKCQGSGRTPYQVSVDLTGPAFKCTCPSRKFPCKHGLALLLLWVEGAGVVQDAAEPADFANDWASDRAQRATKAANRRSTAEEGPVDPEAQQRRLERRLELMTAGAADFERWLGDLYRHGLAAARQRSYSFWDEAAARLADAQLPGLATRVRELPAALHGRDDWADVALVETGRWFAAVRAWQRRDELAPADLANLRAFVGWAVPTDEVLAGARLEGDWLEDDWVVEGVHRSDEGRLQSQRTWVCGARSGERLVILDFAAGGGVLAVPQLVGSVVSTPVAAYPGSGVRRGMFVEDPVVARSDARIAAPTDLAAACEHATSLLAANPFVDRVPVALDAAVAVDERGDAVVVDADGASLPLVAEVEPWELLARTGGASVPMFCELDDGHLRPLSVEIDGVLVGL